MNTNTRFNRNKETIELIKQHLKVNTQSINEIESKISDYDQKFIDFESFKMNESSPFDPENTQTNSTFKNMVILEPPIMEQQNMSITLSKYTKLTDELLQNFDQYKATQAEESMNRIEQLQNDLAEVLESRAEIIAEDLSSKLKNFENQINSTKKLEDARMSKQYEEIERKIKSLDDSTKEEILSLQKEMDNLSAGVSKGLGEIPKVEDHKPLLESLRVQMSQTENRLTETQELLEIKLYQFEDKFQKQLEDLESESQHWSDELRTRIDQYEATSTDREMNLMDEINSLKYEFEILAASQNTNSNETVKLGHYMEVLKQTASESFANIEKKISANSTFDNRVKEIELEVKTLSKNVEDIKQNASKSSLSTGSGPNTDNFRYKTEYSAGKSSEKQPTTNEKAISRYEEVINKSQATQYSHYPSTGLTYKSPENRYSGGDYRSNGLRSVDKSLEPNNTLLNRSPTYDLNGSGTKNTAYQYTKSPSFEGKENLKTSSVLTAQDVSPKSSNYLYPNTGNQAQERVTEKSTAYSGYASGFTGDKQAHSQITSNKSPYPLKIGQDTLRRSLEKGLPKLLSPTAGETQLQSPKINLHLHKFSNPEEVNPLDEEEQEMIYQFDENGFLMDEEGNYILDDQDQMIKLDKEQIERLMANNLLEEEID